MTSTRASIVDGAERVQRRNAPHLASSHASISDHAHAAQSAAPPDGSVQSAASANHRGASASRAARQRRGSGREADEEADGEADGASCRSRDRVASVQLSSSSSRPPPSGILLLLVSSSSRQRRALRAAAKDAARPACAAVRASGHPTRAGLAIAAAAGPLAPTGRRRPYPRAIAAAPPHRRFSDAEKRARRRVCQSPPGARHRFPSLLSIRPRSPRHHLGGFLLRGDASPRPRREPRDDDAPIPRVEIGGASVNRRDDQRRHAELTPPPPRGDGQTPPPPHPRFRSARRRLRRRLRRLSFASFRNRLEQSGRLARRPLAARVPSSAFDARIRIVDAALASEQRNTRYEAEAPALGPSRFAMASPRAFAHGTYERRRAVGGRRKGQRRESRESTRGFRVEVRIVLERFNRRAKERRLGRAAAPIGASTTKTTKKACERDAVLVGVGVGGFATSAVAASVVAAGKSSRRRSHPCPRRSNLARDAPRGTPPRTSRRSRARRRRGAASSDAANAGVHDPAHAAADDTNVRNRGRPRRRRFRRFRPPSRRARHAIRAAASGGARRDERGDRRARPRVRGIDADADADEPFADGSKSYVGFRRRPASRRCRPVAEPSDGRGGRRHRALDPHPRRVARPGRDPDVKTTAHLPRTIPSCPSQMSGRPARVRVESEMSSPRMLESARRLPLAVGVILANGERGRCAPNAATTSSSHGSRAAGSRAAATPDSGHAASTQRLGPSRPSPSRLAAAAASFRVTIAAASGKRSAPPPRRGRAGRGDDGVAVASFASSLSGRRRSPDGVRSRRRPARSTPSGRRPDRRFVRRRPVRRRVLVFEDGGERASSLGGVFARRRERVERLVPRLRRRARRRQHRRRRVRRGFEPARRFRRDRLVSNLAASARASPPGRHAAPCASTKDAMRVACARSNEDDAAVVAANRGARISHPPNPSTTRRKRLSLRSRARRRGERVVERARARGARRVHPRAPVLVASDRRDLRRPRAGATPRFAAVAAFRPPRRRQHLAQRIPRRRGRRPADAFGSTRASASGAHRSVTIVAREPFAKLRAESVLVAEQRR